MKKEESFEQRDKLHSFVREYKPLPSYARSVSRKRKNILFHVDSKQSVCVSGEFNTNTKYFLKKRRKIENNSSECKNDTDIKHRRIIQKNKLLELELKNDEEPDKEKKEALNKAFFWRFRKLLNQRYSSKEMVPHKRKPQTTRKIHQTRNIDSDTDFSNNTQFENISSDDSVEAVSALNTKVNTINIDGRNCACSNKPCTLKARLLASTSNSTLNQTLSEPTPSISAVNNTNTIITNPSNMENNIQRAKAIESDVISCLTNLKNFVNAEVAQLNDTFAKIPLPSSVNPQQPVNNEPQIPPYNINIVNPNIRQLPPQNILYQKYIQNKEELTKNIRILLEQKHKKFNELIHERNACIGEMQHSERNKDYFKLEWLRTRLQYLDHSIEKIQNDCKYDANEVNKFTFEQYLNMLERYKHREMQHLTDVERYNLRQEQLKFFSNDALVEGNRVLEYPFAGIITNTNTNTNTNEQPRQQQQQTMPPIPSYLMQNHTIVREQTHPNNHQHPSSNSINSQNRHPPPYSTRNLPNTTVQHFPRPSVSQVRPNENYPILPQMTQPPETNKKQKSRPTIISSTPKRNLPKILSNTVIRNSTASKTTSKEPVITENTSELVQPQLSAQGNPLRPKPALLPVGVIRKLNEVIIIPDSPIEKTHKKSPSNEEIPNKRIKLNNTTETEVPKQDEKVDTKPENKEETKRKTHLRLQFSLVSNKTITLSYLLKMINQNLNNAAFSNFILKPKNIEELCNIIRKREIFAKIEENSSCQYPNVLTIMNHFLIYVIVCVQIENRINYKELYLRLIRDKEPLRYDYHDAPDQISLEDIDTYLQKAALALHEAIILNSTDKPMKNNKCICSKIKPVTSTSSGQNTEENDSNYFIKAHGETEISIIVLYEPKLKTATKTAKKFTQTCGDDGSTPESNDNKDVKQKTSQNNEKHTQVIHNPTNLNLKLSALKHTLFNFDANKNITFNFDIAKMGFKNLEKILQTSVNQKIVSEIFEHNLSLKTKQITNGPLLENKDIKEKTEPVRKRRISLSETSSEPSLKNKRIQALDLSIKPDFAKINNYKVINVDEKLKPSIHETIINYWKTADKKNQSNHKTNNNNTNNNNIKEKKIRTVIESTLEISNKKYYDNPKLKLNINKNNEFVQKTPLNLSKNMTHVDASNKSKRNHFLSKNSRKFCINFNTLVYINEIDYQIILEILNEVAKPLYTFYKFVNTIRCKNNQPLINFTAFFFGLKFKKLQKYKKMYEELHQK